MICLLAEDWIFVKKWHTFKFTHVLQNINPTFKYIILAILLGLAREERQLQEHDSHSLHLLLPRLEVAESHIRAKPWLYAPFRHEVHETNGIDGIQAIIPSAPWIPFGCKATFFFETSKKKQPFLSSK